MLNSTEHKISTAHKKKYRQMKKFLGLSLSDVVFIMLIHVKMPTIVGILTFMSRINFVLSWVECEKSFITSGPDVCSFSSCVFTALLMKRQGRHTRALSNNFGKSPWPKLGKNDQLNVKIGKKNWHKTYLGAKFIVKIKLFQNVLCQAKVFKHHSDMGHFFSKVVVVS